MTLRWRLFAMFAALIALLMGTHAWLVRSLAQDLASELDQVALVVGSRVASALTEIPTGLDQEEKDDKTSIHRVVRYVHVEERIASQEKGPEPGAAPRPLGADEATKPPKPGTSLAYHFRIDPGGIGEPGHQAQAVAAWESVSHQTVEIRLEEGQGARFLKLAGPDLQAQVPIPKFGLLERLEAFQTKVLTYTLILLLVGLGAAAWIAHEVARPLVELRQAALAVGAGNLGLQIQTRKGNWETREAIQAFNRMSHRLAELDAQNRQLEQSRQLGEIGEIARGLAHTLRNPLNALGLSVEELAERRKEEPDQQQLADQARRQIRRLDRGIRSFLVLASQADGSPAEVDVGGLVRDVALEAIQDQPGRVRVEVEVVAEPVRLLAVEAELRAVVQALVVNAVEASPEGGMIKIRLETLSGDRLRLLVEDQGPGLAAEVRRRLFTPHVTTKSNGSGMGLFLAHRLTAGRYGGSLELVDREIGGTSARLELGPRRHGEAT